MKLRPTELALPLARKAETTRAAQRLREEELMVWANLKPEMSRWMRGAAARG